MALKRWQLWSDSGDQGRDVALALRLRGGPWSGCQLRGYRWLEGGVAAVPGGLEVQAAAFLESGCPQRGCQLRAIVHRDGRNTSSGDSSRAEAVRQPQATAAPAAAVAAAAASRWPREPKGNRDKMQIGFTLHSQLALNLSLPEILLGCH